MLQRVGNLLGTPLRATDDDIGRCRDLLFDDRTHVVRYIVADSGRWIPGRKVLISPISVDRVDGQRVSVALSRKQIEEAPPLAEDAPVSRQHEVAFHKYYGYAFYWHGTALWGLAQTPLSLRHDSPIRAAEHEELDGDPHLRSTREVRNYTVNGRDGQLGGIDDFLLDAQAWVLRYVVVDTGSWLSGRKVLLSPDWFAGWDWVNKAAAVPITKREAEGSPEYRPDGPLDRAYEARLHDFYGRSAYWDVRGV